MNAFIHPTFELRRNIPIYVGALLCLYFGYHVLQGHRSFPALVSLEYMIADKQGELATLQAKREALERKVVMLRPGSINRDFLDERVRVMLGYRHPDEWIVINSSAQ